MMKTLFLQPPSFDGFDGGAGSRYQARREIRSLLVSDLARAAGRAGAGQQADRRAAARASSSTTSLPQAARLRAVRDAHLDAVLRLRREGGRGAEGREPDAQDRLRSAPRSRSQPDESLHRRARDRLRRPQRVRLHHQGGRRRPRPRRRSTASPIATRRASIVAQPRARDPRGHGRAAVRDARSTSATSRIENYFIGYLQHPYVSLYTGPRLQIALHLLPVAADGRRPSLPHAQRRPRDRGDRAAREGASRRSRNSSSTTTPSPTTCRAPRRSRASSASSASPGRATPRPTCRARR